jgi:hypothetical protein
MKKKIPIDKLKKKRWYTLNKHSTIFTTNHPHADEYREIKRTSHKRKFQFRKKDANKTDDGIYPYYTFLEWDPLTNKTENYIVWYDFIPEFLFDETTVPANMKHSLKSLRRVTKKIKGKKRTSKTLKNMARFRLSTLDEKTMRKHHVYKSLLKPKKIGGTRKYSHLAKKAIKNTRKYRIKKQTKRKLDEKLHMKPSDLMKHRIVYVKTQKKSTPSIHRKTTRV